MERTMALCSELSQAISPFETSGFALPPPGSAVEFSSIAVLVFGLGRGLPNFLPRPFPLSSVISRQHFSEVKYYLPLLPLAFAGYFR
jgi:hypothetical protein